MQISESAHGMVLSYPLSTGIAFLAAAVALIVFAGFGRRLIRRRWPVALAALVAIGAGGHFTTFSASLDNDAGRVRAFLKPERSIRWRDAADMYLEHSGNADWRVVVLDARRRSFDFDVADLSMENRRRVMAYIVDRVPAGASSGKPALLVRQAPYASRRVSFAADQQI